MTDPARVLMGLAEGLRFRLPEHFHDFRRGHPLARPGAYYLNLPESVRASLSTLRSDQITNIRPDAFVFSSEGGAS